LSVIDLTATVANETDGSLVLRFDGELDMATSSLVNTLVDCALREGESKVVIDLDLVSFLDSHGLRALLIANQTARDQGATLTVRAPTKQALDVMLMTGCEHVLNIQQA
jgi:anti-sigma B factor antagonist